MIYLIDMADAIASFDDTVMGMDNQDYDLDELVTNWLLKEKESDLDEYYKNYLKSSGVDDSHINDGPILAKAVKRLYREMNRSLRDLDHSRIKRLSLRLSDDMLVVEVI